MCLAVFFKCLFIIEVLFLSLCGHCLVQRRHRDVDVAFVDQFRHKTVKKREQEVADVCAVHVGIRHDHDLVVAELGNVEVVAVAFRKAAAKGVDHRLDLGVCQHLVDACLLDVEDLSADRQDRLIISVARSLCTAPGGISLDDKDLTLAVVFGLTACELSV